MDQQQVLIIVGLVAVAALIITRVIRSNARRKLVREKLAEGAKVVDVRTPGEFAGGHYPGAVNIPLDKLPKRMKKLGSKDGSIIVYCNTGSRSRVALSRLRAAGFEDVINGGGLSSLPR
jgi:phage shock protein E